MFITKLFTQSVVGNERTWKDGIDFVMPITFTIKRSYRAGFNNPVPVPMNQGQMYLDNGNYHDADGKRKNQPADTGSVVDS